MVQFKSEKTFNCSALPTVKYKIELSGASNIGFTGTVIGDGVTTNLAGNLPAVFEFESHDILCSFKKTGGNGEIILHVFKNDKCLGECDTSNEFGGVRAEIRYTPKMQRCIFTTF